MCSCGSCTHRSLSDKSLKLTLAVRDLFGYLMTKSSFFVMGLYSTLQHLVIWDRQDDLEKAPLAYISNAELKNIVKPVAILRYCFEVHGEIHESINMLSQIQGSLHL